MDFSNVNKKNNDLPIGIFDSGVGGLTVLASIHKRLPEENILYLGDTARLPYGTKSSQTIIRYALQAAQILVDRKIKLLVIACNTATAAALNVLQSTFSTIPIIGVIEPGSKAAALTSKTGNILVIGTESTIKNEAYQKAILSLRPDCTITGVACPLFVPLAEEGWIDTEKKDQFVEQGNIAKAIAYRYLSEHFSPQKTNVRPDCIVLGCTHFPPLAPAIKYVIGDDILMVDSAETTAETVASTLKKLKLKRQFKKGNLHFLTTDAPERFARVGSLFLGTDVNPTSLELISL